jgi:hypothetical protein
MTCGSVCAGTQTCDGYAEQHGDGLRALHEPPRAGKIPSPHSFHCKHLKGIEEATQTHSVQPDEEHVAMVTLHSAQRKKRQACNSQSAAFKEQFQLQA